MEDHTDARDFEPSAEQYVDYDDPLTGYNDEQLNPDVNTLFEDESEEQQHAHAEASTHVPPKPARYYSQDGNQPAVRSGSITSDATSEGSGDASVLSSNGSPKDLDQLDMGTLFLDGQPEVANTLAGRRGIDRPAGLALNSKIEPSRASREEVEQMPISSATFIDVLEKCIPDPKTREKVRQHFIQLNDVKNNVAIQTYKLYQRTKTDLDEMKKDYFAGPGDERRRARLEAGEVSKQKNREKKERVIRMALNEDARATRAAMDRSEWVIDKATGMLMSPEDAEEELSDSFDDDDCDLDGSGKDSFEMNEKYSDDEDEKEDEYGGRHEEKSDDDDWPGNNGSRIPGGVPLNGHRNRDSTYSIDKPLPSIPYEETQRTMVNIQILLRLLPVKIALIEQTQAPQPVAHTIYAICQRASSICEYAEQNNASNAMQGRCAFYMGLAEYMRSRIDEESDEMYMPVVMYFENAATLCGDEFEEGVWGEEWARWLRGGMEYFGGRPLRVATRGSSVASPELDEREGDDEGLVTWMLNMMRGTKAAADGKPAPAQAQKDGKPAPTLADELRNTSGSSDFGGRFAPGMGTKLQRPEDVKAEADEEQVPNNVFGGMVSVTDLPQAPPKRTKLVGLGIDTDAPPAVVENTILSPSQGIFASPERYANGLARSPTTPTIDKIIDAGVYIREETPSPHTQTSPTKGYHVTNPDRSLANVTTSGEDGGLPAPVTSSPAVSPSGGGNGIFSSFARRLSSAISPTLGTSKPQSPSNTGLQETTEEDETAESTSNSYKRLSIAQRRSSHRGSIAALGSMILHGGRSPTKSHDVLAEEGESPLLQQTFRDAASSSGTEKKSPLSPPGSGGDESGLRRRKSSGRAGEDML